MQTTLSQTDMAELLSQMIDYELQQQHQSVIDAAAASGDHIELTLKVRIKLIKPTPAPAPGHKEPTPAGFRDGICCICTTGPGGWGPPYCRGDCC